MTFQIKKNNNLIPRFCLFQNTQQIIEVNLSCPSKFRFDFFILAQSVNYMDRSISRKNTKDGWTRDFDISIPVHDLNKWNENKKMWQELLTFLTGDRWKLSFSKINIIKEQESMLVTSKQDGIISLLSGGLDSLIGAIDLLASNTKVFFSNSGEPLLSKRVYHSCKGTYSTNVLGYKCHRVTKIKGENTQRSRSLLFLANALLDIDNKALKNFQISKIVIPENGFIGINVPLSFARLGSASTKTAHPYYLEKLEKLWHSHELNISLSNPYQLKTKGEMLIECRDQTLIQQLIAMTMSCAHPKKIVNNNSEYRSGKDLHCGYCWPCLIRRAAIIHYSSDSNYRDITRYADISNIKKGINQKDYFVLQRFLSTSLSIFDDLRAGSFYIRTPETTTMSIGEIQSLMKRGIEELKKL